MDGKRVRMAKGGVDVMLRRVSYIDDGNGGRQITDDDISRIEQINHKLSSEGLRVLAFAAKDYDSGDDGFCRVVFREIDPWLQ